MNETISSDCRRAFGGAAFRLTLFAAVLMLAAGCFNSLYRSVFLNNGKLLPAGTCLSLYQEAVSSQAVFLAAPILSTLPYTGTYLEELQNGYVKAFLPRAGFKRYIFGKLIACGLSGGAVLAAGVIVFLAASGLLLSPLEAADPQGFFPPGFLPGLLDTCTAYFCAGMLFSLFGLAVSAATESRYLAYTAPFICSYFLVILRSRYFKALYVLDPREWLVPSAAWPHGTGGSALLMGELALLCALWFVFTAERRLRSL